MKPIPVKWVDFKACESTGMSLQRSDSDKFNAPLLCHLNVIDYLLVYLLVRGLVRSGRYRVVRP